jgi:hypothetical protein
MQYHQDTFLPNLNAFIDNCHKFYHNTTMSCRAFITISNSSFVRVRSGLCSSLVGAPLPWRRMASVVSVSLVEKCRDMGTILCWGNPTGPQHVPCNGKWWIWKNWQCAMGQSTTSPPSFCSSGLCQMPIQFMYTYVCIMYLCIYILIYI